MSTAIDRHGYGMIDLEDIAALAADSWEHRDRRFIVYDPAADKVGILWPDYKAEENAVASGLLFVDCADSPHSAPYSAQDIANLVWHRIEESKIDTHGACMRGLWEACARMSESPDDAPFWVVYGLEPRVIVYTKSSYDYACEQGRFFRFPQGIEKHSLTFWVDHPMTMQELADAICAKADACGRPL